MSRPVERAFVGLGSNLDDPVLQVRRAIRALSALPQQGQARASALYRSAPWGVSEQPAFVNAVVELRTTLTAEELLQALLAIERAAGRRRDGSRWGPRILDLDVLLYGNACIDAPGLRVPHPHLHERAFVLLPLAELAPEAIVPGRGRIDHLLAGVDCSGCERIGPAAA